MMYIRAIIIIFKSFHPYDVKLVDIKSSRQGDGLLAFKRKLYWRYARLEVNSWHVEKRFNLFVIEIFKEYRRDVVRPRSHFDHTVFKTSLSSSYLYHCGPCHARRVIFRSIVQCLYTRKICFTKSTRHKTRY